MYAGLGAMTRPLAQAPFREIKPRITIALLKCALKQAAEATVQPKIIPFPSGNKYLEYGILRGIAPPGQDAVCK